MSLVQPFERCYKINTKKLQHLYHQGWLCETWITSIVVSAVSLLLKLSSSAKNRGKSFNYNIFVTSSQKGMVWQMLNCLTMPGSSKKNCWMTHSEKAARWFQLHCHCGSWIKICWLDKQVSMALRLTTTMEND